MKKQQIEEKELKLLFNSSITDKLPDDFTDQVLESILDENYSKSSYTPSGLIRSIAYGVYGLLFLLLVVSLLLKGDKPVWSTFLKEQVTSDWQPYLNHPLLAITFLALSIAVWLLIYIHKQVGSSMMQIEK